MAWSQYFVVAGNFPIRDLEFAKAQAVRMAIEGQTTIRIENASGQLIAAYGRKGDPLCLKCETAKVDVDPFPGKLCPKCDVVAV